MYRKCILNIRGEYYMFTDKEDDYKRMKYIIKHRVPGSIKQGRG